MKSRTAMFVLLLACAATSDAFGQQVPVDLPEGFAITKVAGNNLVPDASAMTVGPDGHPIVCGPGYVRKMIDEDGDGRFETYQTLAETKGIAQGVWFDGEQLWLTVDGALRRSKSGGKDKPFDFERVVSVTTDAEHGSHAIRQGPDGWWYVICGNATEIRQQYHALETSPVSEPRAGFLMRFPPDVETGDKFVAEIVCHGFRNAYDFDFDSSGRIFVYDSDGERDISLPWYRPTRIFRVQPGDDAGWVSASWKRPASYFDMPVLVGELGRGSPTGVAVCSTDAFGSRYHDSVFVGDWTFGRIATARSGQTEMFARPIGNFGFAVTDLEFAPDGSLYVTTGGRGTEGSLYRITRVGDPGLEKGTRNEAGNRIAQQEFEDDQGFKVARQRLLLEEATPQSFARLLTETLNGEDAEVATRVRRLQRMLGGCDGVGMFGGHQAKTPLKFAERNLSVVGKDLLALLERKVASFEVARLIGMVQPRSDVLADSLADCVAFEKDPVARIHYLNCLAVAGGKLGQEKIDSVAEALLRIRREIDAAGLPVDRNWKPRMSQLASELFRDMRLAEAIVTDASFGLSSDVWMFDSLPEIFLAAARVKIAARIKTDPNLATQAQLQCLSSDPRYRELLRTYHDRSELTDLIAMSVHRQPEPDDRAVLIKGLSSLSLTVNKASLAGLRKLCEGGPGQQKPEKEQLAQIAKLSSRLGWSNPEVSVRDQAVLLLRKSTGDNWGYELRQYDLAGMDRRLQQAAIDRWLAYLGYRHGVRIRANESAGQMMSRLSRVDFARGDLDRGKQAFAKFQCASCHQVSGRMGGGQNSGPKLQGIASRFSREDVFRAILDPNASVPDRYRAVMVLTKDGQLIQGSVVYESMAGIMMATRTGEIVRINAEDIESRRKSSESLMPAGLLNDATDEEIADLWAWLESLK